MSCRLIRFARLAEVVRITTDTRATLSGVNTAGALLFVQKEFTALTIFLVRSSRHQEEFAITAKKHKSLLILIMPVLQMVAISFA